MKMKLPLSIVILIVWLLSFGTYGFFQLVKEESVDARLKEIGGANFHGSELKSWKAGSCYVFGVSFEKRPPSFFSNCQK